MNELAPQRLALLGMPRTGKSTYLGVLWALIQSHREPSVSEARFSGDRSYIQRLAEQVARGEELSRTAIESSEEMAVTLTFDPGGLVDLVIPDSSGESLRLLVEDRSWYPSLLAACEDLTAILLFVHPERLRQPQPASLLGGVVVAPAAAPREPVEFTTREYAGTAAQLIDAFENIAEIVSDRWPIRLAIVISAWDTVDGSPPPTPYEWMRLRLPALLATIESNPQIADLAVFGVSAQGGSLDAPEELLAKGEIFDRVFAQDRDGRPISLTAPVSWAIWGAWA